MQLIIMLTGYTVLKSAQVMADEWETTIRKGGGQTLCRYRLALNVVDGRYAVHVEHRESNGTVSEAFLFLGDNLLHANDCWNRHAARYEMAAS